MKIENPYAIVYCAYSVTEGGVDGGTPTHLPRGDSIKVYQMSTNSDGTMKKQDGSSRWDIEERLLALVPREGFEGAEGLENLCKYYAQKHRATSIQLPDGRILTAQKRE